MARHGNGEVGRVVLAGEQTIRNVEATHAALLDARARHAMVEIDCRDTGPTDLSFVQCLLAARAGGDGPRARLARPLSGALREVLERGGFLAGQAPDDEAFWWGAAAS